LPAPPLLLPATTITTITITTTPRNALPGLRANVGPAAAAGLLFLYESGNAVQPVT
jgi:hypothetical protein